MGGRLKIAINRNNPDLWKDDTRKSVEQYNKWFLDFAPDTYLREREKAKADVHKAMRNTDCLRISGEVLSLHPELITILRMATTPPLARDRLIGLSGVKKSFLTNLEAGRLPKKTCYDGVKSELDKLVYVINKLLDVELLPWLKGKSNPADSDLKIAECIIADRLCGTLSDPIIRNEQEKRQLGAISKFLETCGYVFVPSSEITSVRDMERGTFTYHLNVPVDLQAGKSVNIPVDVAVMRKTGSAGILPLLVECKSAGDFTNTNKRRKEEAQKIEQLKATYGQDVDFVLFLCGYFDSGYLGNEAAEGIDWVWEHRIEDFLKTGV